MTLFLDFDQVRPSIEAALKAADPDLRTFDYIAEGLVPPCACVIPGQPYLEWRRPNDEIPFGHFVARIDVLLVSHRETAKRASALIEEQIYKAVKALKDDYDIRRVTQPGVIKLNGAKFIGAALTIEETVKEPD